ncbi:MAG TPA: MMPL family transporter [Thermoplasmata archaeon]|nr:MMPL family transporter [Thermoplasmata archaeon]
MATPARAPPAEGGRRFAALARWIIRHPWYPVIFWVALLLVTVPFLERLSSVTTNSTDSVPTNSPSAQAAARLAALFPNTTGAASAIVLLTGPNVTDAFAQRLVLNLTTALATDRGLAAVAGVSSVYTAYAGYLAGQAELVGGVLRPALETAPSLPDAINASAALLWGPPILFLGTWETLIANTSRTPAAWNPYAYNATAANLSGNATELALLRAFYAGGSPATPGFNGTPGCAGLANESLVVACADTAARSNFAPLLPTLVPADEVGIARAALDGLGIANASAPIPWDVVRAVGAAYLGNASGLPAAWVDTVWTAFPDGVLTPSAAAAFANATVAAATLATEPLPVPLALASEFVAPHDAATIVEVEFSVADSATNASGGMPVYADLPKIDSLAGSVVRASDPSGAIQYVVTGPAALDLLTQQAVDSALATVLPLTIGLLLGISMIYFRSPLTPLATFAGLGIALALALGGVVLVGTLIEHVDSTSLTLAEVFVLGIGTDYSIFLVARFREELVHGKSTDQAIETSLRWAGQSIATSGSTAILVTLALAVSGVALLAQWGMVLSVAVLITMLLSLTLVPAFLKLIGPRIFWPNSGARFARRAAVVADRVRRQDTYFYRAGRLTQRHAVGTLTVLLLLSVPLLAIALTVPVSYDYYAQLPGGHPATIGLDRLGSTFGNGYAVPSFALVTFAAPLVVANATNATEFVDLENLTAIANGTAGIAAVKSPVGPYGAPLESWLLLDAAPPAARANLLGTLGSYVGSDGRTVLLSLQTKDTGLSGGAVAAVEAVEASFDGYRSSHPDITALAFGGGAPTIHDLAQETDRATELMIVAVTIGLVVVLLAVLRSWIIAVLAVGTIGLSIGWAWAITYLCFDLGLGFPLFFYVRTLLFMLVLGLGIDYNIFVLTRVREETLAGRSAGEAALEAVGRTGGIITAAAVILACAFAALIVGEFTLIRAIGFSVAIAVVLDAMVVRTYFVPSVLQLLGARVWNLSGRRTRAAPATPPPPAGDGPSTP